VLAEHGQESLSRFRIVRFRRRAPLFVRRRFPFLERIQEPVPRVLPLELAEPHERLRELGRVFRGFGDEREKQRHGLFAELVGEGGVRLDPLLDLLFEHGAQVLGDLHLHAAGALER
jgi:hypothetical protein